MDLTSLLPILIPCGLIQISVQAYYIRHCWLNRELTQKQKVKYIIGMALLNLPAAAFYLLQNSRKPEEQTYAFRHLEMDPQVRQGIFVLLFIAYEVVALSIITSNLGNVNYYLIVMLLGGCFVLIIVHHIFVTEKMRILNYLLPIIMVLLVVPIYYVDLSDRSLYLLAVVFGGNIIKLPESKAKGWAFLAVFLFLVTSVAKALDIYSGYGSDDIVSFTYFNTLQFLLMILALYSIKKQLTTHRRMEEVLRTVRVQATQLEELRVVEERNRIAADIHDTVGHTLTSAAITIEAAAKSVKKDPVEAEAKLFQAREQVIQGLDEIRNSVRTIREGTSKGFQTELDKLIHQVEDTGGIKIHCIVEVESQLAPIQQRVLIQAIRESLTNAMKHGGGTEADILLREYDHHVYLTMTDNGKGTAVIHPGSGLSIMKERITSLGGSFQVDSEPGEGFSVNLSIPVGTSIGGTQDE
jgi:signal transduction histidine kinase